MQARFDKSGAATLTQTHLLSPSRGLHALVIPEAAENRRLLGLAERSAAEWIAQLVYPAVGGLVIGLVGILLGYVSRRLLKPRTDN